MQRSRSVKHKIGLLISWPHLGGNPKFCFLGASFPPFSKETKGWKREYLSLGGKISLIKDTMTNLPIYFLSIKMPVKVLKMIEKIERDFFRVRGEKQALTKEYGCLLYCLGIVQIDNRTKLFFCMIPS